MTPKRAFALLSGLVGRVFAQIICWALMLLVLAGGARIYRALDESVTGGVDPIHFIWFVAITMIVLISWRLLASTDLDG